MPGTCSAGQRDTSMMPGMMWAFQACSQVLRAADATPPLHSRAAQVMNPSSGKGGNRFVKQVARHLRSHNSKARTVQAPAGAVATLIAAEPPPWAWISMPPG